MKQLSLLIITFFLFAKSGIAQINEFSKNADPQFFEKAGELGWIKIKENKKIEINSIFTTYKNKFFRESGYEMILKKTKEDNIGFTHYYYQQQYQGKNIEGGEFILHKSSVGAITGNGKLYTPQKISATANITEASALENALAVIKAKQYKWQNAFYENKIKQRKGDGGATYYPKGTMVFLYDDKVLSLRLCYRFYIQAVDVENSFCVYIDAASGGIIKKIPLTNSCSAGTFTSNWYGQQTVFTFANNPFELEDNCTPSVYQTNDATTLFNDVFTDADNNWTTDKQRSAATSLWGIRTTRDWFATVFGRNGHGNGGEDIDIYHGYTFANGNTNNANYSFDPTGDDEIRFGIGNTAFVTDDWNPIDVCAHEFTHGVDQYEGALVYEKESGALDESFADIFGEYIEFKTLGANNWGVGWHMLVNNNPGSNNPIRNFVNPLIIATGPQQPNTYLGLSWTPVTGPDPGDNWGVHINSGVQNQMFYLLTVGGSGWNNGQTCQAPANNGFPWSVSGIGIEKSIQIAYRVLTVYMGNNSTYFDARNAWVAAAVDLFGPCSFEAIQVGRAWYSVGIFPPGFADEIICGTFGNNPFNYVKSGQLFIAQNCSVNILGTGNLVKFTAGQRIVINPGFSSLNGSRFTATINSDCIFASF